MTHLTRRKFIATSAAAGAALTSVGATASVFAQDDSTTISVGSKNYTEQIIMGETLALLLEDAGYNVERSLNLGGTAIAHEALVAGDIDTYVEYTGTALAAILSLDVPESEPSSGAATPAGATPEVDLTSDPAYQVVAEAYPEELGVKWLKPFGFNNTYTVLVRPETAEEYNLSAMSDLEGVAGDLVLGSDQEFPVRDDGLPAFEETYGFSFQDVTVGDIGLMYQALADGEVDAIIGYTTDGRIPALDLVILEDDKSFFPPYHAAPIVRLDALDENPEIEEVLNQPAGLITNDMMAATNFMVDEEGAEPIDAARSLLQDLGILEA